VGGREMNNSTTAWPAQHREALLRSPEDGTAFLDALRKQAFARFQERGFPTLRQERWRFTDVSTLAESPWKRAAEYANGDLVRADWQSFGPVSYRIVYVNGQFSPLNSNLPASGEELSVHPLNDLPEALRERVLKRMAETLAQTDEPFALLNSALLSAGAVLSVPDRAVLTAPIEIVHYFDSPGEAAAHPRLLIFVGDQAEAVIIESHAGRAGSRYFTNPMVDVVIGAESHLIHYQLQQESSAATHISYTRSSLGPSSHYSRFAIDFGGRLVRHDMVVELNGEGAEATLNGLYMPKERQHIDHHTTLRHLQPHTFSRQLYKGVLQDKAHAVFNGRIFVAREAQRTDAIQYNKNLILSDDALANTQPQLEIFADDVRCTHGGTIGQLNQEGLFYLRSRGIGAKTARQIMVRAFAGEIVQGIKSDAVREQVEKWMTARLGGEE
jgi:Fe-S cluster assembly protein SufD